MRSHAFLYALVCALILLGSAHAFALPGSGPPPVATAIAGGNSCPS